MKHLVIISPETAAENETATVNALFDEGLQYFHLRKRNISKTEQKQYLAEIKPKYLNNIAIHQHLIVPGAGGLRLHFNEKGRMNLNKTDLELLQKQGFHFSTSLHDGAKINSLSSVWEYAFLGPVFPSISKPGYENKILETLVIDNKSVHPAIIAIGGITPGNAEKALYRGFDGIAVLGAIWNDRINAIKTFKILQALCSN